MSTTPVSPVDQSSDYEIWPLIPDVDWTPDGGDTFAWADPVPYDYSSNQRPWTLDSLTDDELTSLGLA